MMPRRVSNLAPEVTLSRRRPESTCRAGDPHSLLLNARFPATHGVRIKVVRQQQRTFWGRLAQAKGKLSMRLRSFGLTLTVVGALAVLSACETPTMEDFNTLESRVDNLEAQVSAAEAQASEAAAGADQCQQVCERADRMFQQNLRK
jgi:hypothetical protein